MNNAANTAPSSPQRVRRSGLVIAFGAALMVGMAVLALAVLTSIPNQKALMTPAPVAEVPAFAASVEEKVAAADPDRGPRLFEQYACAGCHSTPDSAGPYVRGLGERAATRRPNYSAAAYIYESITNPNAFTVPDYPASVMVQNYKRTIPEDDLYSLIAWLLKQ